MAAGKLVFAFFDRFYCFFLPRARRGRTQLQHRVSSGYGETIIGTTNILRSSYLKRIIWDNLFVWILAVLLISMVAGIIIDTFSVLKNECKEKEENL